MSVPKFLILFGVIIAGVGLVLAMFPNIYRWMGHLPGDILIEKDRVKFFFPVVTCVMISLVVSLLLRFFN